MNFNCKNVNPRKLFDELLSSGIVILSATNDLIEGQHIADNTWFVFDEGTDMTLVQSIIDAHDPTPLPKLPTDKERIDMLENMILLMMEG